MLDKLKKSEKISFIATIILLIALIAFIPIILNIKFLLGIGYYNFDRNYVSDYPEGSVGINVKISIKHLEGDQCRGSILVKTISSGNIHVYGITQIEYSIKVNNSYSSTENEIVNPATQVWSRVFFVSVRKNDKVSVTGIAEVKYSVSGSEQTVAYNFDLSITIPISVAHIYYYWDMPLMWLVILNFTILIVVGYFFARKLNYIRHIYTYPEELKKKDEDFFKFIKKRLKEKKYNQ